MSDPDRKGPIWRRPRTNPDRDIYTDKHTPAPGVPAFVEEECTGKYEGEDLARMRARRPTPERISKLEEKHDKLDEKVDAMHGDLREMRGEFRSAMTTLNATLADKGKTDRARISTNGKVLIAIVGGIITTAGGVLIAVLS